MKPGAAAPWVRGRALLRRRLGHEGAARLISSGGLEPALGVLASGPYGREIRPGMDLEQAQTAVQAALLWHMRILAGWDSAVGVSPLRTLAGGFEIRNVVCHLAGLAGRPLAAPYELGSLSTAWTAVGRESTVEGVRAALARSEWGDPGSGDPGHVLLAMRLAWARRVWEQIPEAGEWARSAVAAIRPLAIPDEEESATDQALWRNVRAVLGRRIDDPTNADGPSWDSEIRWWLSVERSSEVLARTGAPGRPTTVGVIGLLAADAWRVNAALTVACGRGSDPDMEAALSGVA
jgi:hypothetical protein